MRRRRQLLIILLSLIALAIILFALLYALQPLARTTVPVHVKVDGYIGINLDVDKLYFGTVFPGGRASRNIDITSPKDAYVIITAAGQTAEWVTPLQNGFLIEGGRAQTVSFVLENPSKTPKGNYTGTVTFTLYRPLVKHLVPSP